MISKPEEIKGRVYIKTERCKGCIYCIEFCPQGVLEESKDFNPKGYHYPVVVKDVCINCTLCLSLCPDYAIFSVRVKPGEKKSNIVPLKSVSEAHAKSEAMQRGGGTEPRSTKKKATKAIAERSKE